jgi:four helix bundle protein
VAANYRAACRPKSRADFTAKMGIVEEEADESAYWMELLVDIELLKPELLRDLIDEAYEILAMVVSSIKTAKKASQNLSDKRRTQSAKREAE